MVLSSDCPNLALSNSCTSADVIEQIKEVLRATSIDTEITNQNGILIRRKPEIC